MSRSSRRNKDELFQQDPARTDQQKGTQQVYDKSKFRKKLILSALFGLLFGYIMGCIFVGFLGYLIYKIYSKLPFEVLHKNIHMEKVNGVLDSMLHVGTSFPGLFFVLFIAAFGTVYFLYQYRKYGKREALKEDHTDINTFSGDRNKLTLEEMFQQYAIIPDAGAVSRTVNPTAIVGHAFIDNHKKLKSVKIAERDENGEYLKNKQGKIKYKSCPLFDTQLQKESFESIGILNEENQIKIDPFKMNYKKIDGKWQTVGDFINKDWYLPTYEKQRPAGIFFVETAPVNSVAIAITRGNKGQAFVNHTIDMFSRENEIQNMFINDPKGELFTSFHKLLELRGYEPIVFNLLDPSKTHQFNVLGPAIAMARIGDFDKMRDLLNTIMHTFFPVESEDPFWGQAQQALVKMIIFSMIDYYLEEEKAYLNKWAGKRDESTIGRDLDGMWGKVTMFNVYQMLTTMSRKEVYFCEKAIENSDPLSKKDIQSILKFGNNEEFISKNGHKYRPEDVKQLTELSAFFRLMTLLPENKMRTITLQQSDAMNLMASSEKTSATVYGIALVALLFFTNGPVTAITSASPRQSLDPLSLAFPRRLRFKLNNAFLKMQKLSGRKVIFEAYRDEAMKDKIVGKNPEDFEHETKLDHLGWVEFRFKGIFEEYEFIEEDDGSVTKVPKPVYIRMKIIDDKTSYSMFTYNFEFTRGYAKTVDGKRFIHNPRTNQRIEQGGTLRLGEVIDGKFKRNQKEEKLLDGRKVIPIEQTDAVYNIRPKAIFSVTPPNQADYIKIVLVMVSVLFDTSVGESYITKANGKPFYKVRNILDELGNMAFEGHGIANFQTKLSIGLGQGQEYTMILQTLQQLRDVYGESVDKIVSSNTAVFMYLISNDTDMLEELSKQAGTKHVPRTKQKNVEESVGNVVDTVGEKVGYVYTTEEEPLFTVNELMSFTNGESMVLSTVHRKDNSGSSVRPNPIHNTRETLIPMAYALHKDGHNNKEFKRELKNVEIATSSTDRDVYQDIPNFSEMYERRLAQASRSNDMKNTYLKKHNLTEEDLINIDKDEIADSVMRMVNTQIDVSQNESKKEDVQDSNYMSDKEKEMLDESKYKDFDLAAMSEDIKDEDKMYQSEKNKAFQEHKQQYDADNKKLFVDQTLSMENLRQTGQITNLLGKALLDAKINENTINDDLYRYKTEGNFKRIYFNDGTLIAEYEFDINSRSSDAVWYIKPEFFDRILTVAKKAHIEVSNPQAELSANVKEVNEYFDFDNRGVVKRNFIQLFEAEEEPVDGE